MAKKSTRRGNNEGCISKRKDGNWVGVVTLGTDENGKRIRKSVYGKTKSGSDDENARGQSGQSYNRV